MDAASFAIDTATGPLKTLAVLDYETKNSYSVIVSVHDGGDSDGNPDTTVDDTIEVTINVTDEEEAGSVALSPAQPVVGTVLTAILTDPDGSISAATWVWASSTDGSTGWTDISVATSASYTPAAGDVGKHLRATVTYTDEEGAGKSAQGVSANTVMAAAPVNHAPAFADDTATLEVAENTSAEENIGGPVTAADPDSGDTLVYSLSGVDAASFDIEAATGQLKTLAALDYESKNSYQVAVEVSDGNLTDTIRVTINVTNVDEAGSVALTPAQPVVGTVLTATLTDPDGSLSGATWVWASSTDGSTGWTDISGAASASYTPVAGDAGKYLRATATYTDGEGAGKSAQGVTHNAVQAAPVTNRAPEFTADMADRNVAENTSAGENIGGPVTAADPDSGDTLVYSLSGVDAASFDIEAATGQLKTLAALDYESKNSYQVAVEVSDGNLTDTIRVTINVTNVDEAGSVALTPAQPVVGTVLTATLTDPDGSLSGATWVWASSTDGSTGWTDISGAASASYTPVAGDAGKYLRATATYTDGEGAGKSAQGVTHNAVQAAPVTNRAPEFTADMADRNVAENTSAGENIGGPVTAADPDSRDTLVYSLLGVDAASFDIEAATGQLKTLAALDYESRRSYQVTVEVSDGMLTDTIRVTINVTDVVETSPPPGGGAGNRPPQLMGSTVVDYSENATGSVGTYTATDPEGAAVRWSLSGEDSDDLSISADGVLSFNASPDFEGPTDADTDNEYEVTIHASDGSLTDTIEVTINVVNVDEPGSVALSLAQPVVGTVLTATLTDPDGSLSGATWVWASSTDGSTGWTDISGATAASYTPVAGDAESYLRATASYTDGEGAGKSAQGVSDNAVEDTINVIDGDEQLGLSGSSAVSYAENGTVPVAGYTATDPEGAGVSWSLSGDDADEFSISAGGVLSFNASPNFEDAQDANAENTYLVTVEVSDGILTDTIEVTINVTDEEELGVVALSPAQPVVGVELTASLSDPDGSVAGVVWQWASSTDGSTGWTDISGATSASSASYTPVTGDVGKHLRATATYTDGEGAGKSAQGVTHNAVQAAPVTNRAPEFTADMADRNVAENTSAGENIGGPVTAADPDSGDTLVYSLSGVDAGSFDIEAATGQLKTRAALDYESRRSYQVTVEVSDGILTDTIGVTINVTDVVETSPPPGGGAGNRPPQLMGSTVVEYSENATGSVGAYTATDPEGAAVRWSLSGEDSDDLSISADGVLSFNASPDFEGPTDADTDNEYEVTIHASDGSLTDTIEVTINVVNVDESGSVALSLAQPMVGLELTATLTDPDGSISDTIWVWASSTDGSTGWTDISGATSRSYTPTADDADSYLRATATYTDGEGVGKSAQAGSDNAVQAAAAAIRATFFPEDTASRSVAENTVAGKGIGAAVVATNAEGDILTYSLSGTDGGFFDLDASTGQLQTNAALDYETKSSYTVVLSVHDGMDVDGNTDTSIDTSIDDTIEVTIGVTDVNEAPGQPTAPTATAGLASLTVSWTEPANTGPAIGDYDYRYRVKSLSQKSLLPCLQQSGATTGVTISEDTATYDYERPC